MTLPYCKDIETTTQGRVKCNLLPKAVTSPPGTFDAVRDGLADMSFTVHGYTPGRFVLSDVVEFPLMGDTAEAMSVAYQRIYDRHLAKFDEHKGVVTLVVFTHGPGEIYNVKRPIAEIKDFDGLKIRIGGGVINDVTRLLGAVPILKPVTESYEMLSSGVADGTFLPKETPLSLKLMPLIKHVTYVPGGLYNVSFMLMANPAKWAQIAPADREAIAKISGEALARRFGRVWDEADARGQKAVIEAGIPIVNASPQLVAAIRQTTAGLENAWIEKVKAKGADGAAILSALRAEIATLQKK
jgi:TRAP-type C4-dicarboxylate transport system substrate-binding protein